MFLHTHLVEASKDNTVRRHVRGQSQRIDINGPAIQQDYAQYYNSALFDIMNTWRVTAIRRSYIVKVNK